MLNFLTTDEIKLNQIDASDPEVCAKIFKRIFLINSKFMLCRQVYRKYVFKISCVCR